MDDELAPDAHLDPDLDEDELLAAWEAVDRQAAEVLELACAEVLSEDVPASLGRAAAGLRAGVERGGWPFDYFRKACGWGDAVPSDDLELWLHAAAGVVSPDEDPGIDVEELGGIGGLEHADWLALVAGLVRRGVGAELDAHSWFTDLSSLPELEGDAPGDLEEFYGPVVETIAPLWQALGALDDERRLTEMGRWGLPQALLAVWSGVDEAPQLSDEEVAVALEILAERARSLEELQVELDRRGVSAELESLADSLAWRPDVYAFEDGIWAFLPGLVEGAVLTHRLTEDEKARELVNPVTDLGLWDFLAMDGLPLAGGGEVRSHFGLSGPLSGGTLSGLAGPPDWLGGFEAGDLVGFRYAGGTLSLEPVQPVEDPAWREQLLTLARRLAEAGAAKGADVQENQGDYAAAHTLDLAMTLLRDHPGSLDEARPPWTEVLADSGLELHNGYLGVPGTAWQVEPAWLEDAERAVYRGWTALLSADRLGVAPSSEDLAAVAAGLQGVVVDLAAVDLVAERDRETLVVQMLEASTGASRAGPLYLRARVAEALGDSLAMRDLLEAAVAADPTHEDALADLADLRALAGDAREASRLYARAEVDPQAPEVHGLRPFLDPPAGGPGRNKPCPCGSGKKYKVCHGRTDRHPLADRGAWLLVKLKSFLQRSVNRETLYAWALVTRGETGDDAAVSQALSDALAWDLAVFDGGVLTDFQRLAGPLLPEDEVELLDRWAESSRRLLEVTAVRESLGIAVRDVLTGEEFDVPTRVLSQELSAHHVVYGRLVDLGDGRHHFWDDPVGIPDPLRTPFADLLRSDPTPVEVANYLSPATSPTS